MGLLKCTESFFEHVDNGATTVPIEVLQECIFSKVLYNDLISLNRTACLNSVENFESDITYACTYYFLTSNQTDCFQFFHSQANLYDSRPCYSVGEELARLFDISESPLNIVVFFLSVVAFFVMFTKPNPYAKC